MYREELIKLIEEDSKLTEPHGTPSAIWDNLGHINNLFEEIPVPDTDYALLPSIASWCNGKVSLYLYVIYANSDRQLFRYGTQVEVKLSYSIEGEQISYSPISKYHGESIVFKERVGFGYKDLFSLPRDVVFSSVIEALDKVVENADAVHTALIPEQCVGRIKDSEAIKSIEHIISSGVFSKLPFPIDIDMGYVRHLASHRLHASFFAISDQYIGIRLYTYYQSVCEHDVKACINLLIGKNGHFHIASNNARVNVNEYNLCGSEVILCNGSYFWGMKTSDSSRIDFSETDIAMVQPKCDYEFNTRAMEFTPSDFNEIVFAALSSIGIARNETKINLELEMDKVDRMSTDISSYIQRELDETYTIPNDVMQSLYDEGEVIKYSDNDYLRRSLALSKDILMYHEDSLFKALRAL